MAITPRRRTAAESACFGTGLPCVLSWQLPQGHVEVTLGRHFFTRYGTVSTGGVAYQGFRPRVACVCIYAVYTVCTRVHTIAISGRRLRSEALRILPLSRRLSLKANNDLMFMVLL